MSQNRLQANDIQNKFLLGDTLQTLKLLPDGFYDLGITSPPYNKQEKNNGWLVKNVQYDVFVDINNEEDYQQNQIDVLNELFRITKEGGSFFYNHKTRWDKGNMIHPMTWLAKSNWHIRQETIWDRTIASNIRGWRFWQVDERIYCLYKPVGKNKIGTELESKHSLMTSIWRFPPERDNPHPAPFPIELPTRCIYSILNEQKKCNIIDPYSGSGTTALASQLLGHNFTGIDISQDYIDMSKNRLLKELSGNKDIKNFQQEIDRHIVKKTFKQRKLEGKYADKTTKNCQHQEVALFDKPRELTN